MLQAALDTVRAMVHLRRSMLHTRLRLAREAAGLTQGQLAARIDVDRNTVNRAENGHCEPLAHTIGAWAVACGVTSDVLLGIGAAPSAPGEPAAADAARASSDEAAE